MKSGPCAERHRGNIERRQEQMLYFTRNRSFILEFCSNKESSSQISQSIHSPATVYLKNSDFLICPHLWTPIVPPDVRRKAASALLCPAAPAAPPTVIGSSWAFIYGMVEQINYGIRSVGGSRFGLRCCNGPLEQSGVSRFFS